MFSSDLRLQEPWPNTDVQIMASPALTQGWLICWFQGLGKNCVSDDAALIFTDPCRDNEGKSIWSVKQ